MIKTLAHEHFARKCGRVFGALVIYADSHLSGRPSLNTVQVTEVQRGLRFVATDGTVLAAVEIDMKEEIGLNKEVLFSVANMKALASSLKRGSISNLTLTLEIIKDEFVLLGNLSDNLTICSYPIGEMEYPKWQSKVPDTTLEDGEYHTALSGENLIRAGELIKAIDSPAFITYMSQREVMRIDVGKMIDNAPIRATILAMPMYVNFDDGTEGVRI